MHLEKAYSLGFTCSHRVYHLVLIVPGTQFFTEIYCLFPLTQQLMENRETPFNISEK